MFARLPESNAKRQRRTGGFIVSTVAHALVIALAVRATGLTAAPPPKTDVPPTIWIAPKPDQPAPPQPTRRFSDPSLRTLPREAGVIAPGTIILPNIPEPGSMSGLLEPAFDSTHVSTNVGRPGGLPNVADGAPFPEDVVEKAVVALPGTATPRYPSMLQSAGVEGDVRAQFVVDTLGKVEQGSFRALEPTHDLFAGAVRDALTHARFKPAEFGGHKVRQLVEQTFTFRITK